MGCGVVAALTLASAFWVEEREMGPVKERGRSRWGRGRKAGSGED
jgi:hypothetical protein